MTTHISSLETPCFCIDENILNRNIRSTLSLCEEHNLHIRPNVKTHKSTVLGRLQHGNKSSNLRIGTSTLKECEAFLRDGFDDVLYCVPLAGLAKVKQALKLNHDYPHKFSIMIDNEDQILYLEKIETQDSGIWNAFIKVDCGYGRAGRRDEPLVRVIKRAEESKVINVRGVYAHAGHSYHSTGLQTTSIARQEIESVVQAKNIFPESRQIQLILSIGSTPTASVYKEILQSCPGIYEIHPGNYIFYDRQQAQIGSCDTSDIACFVLSTVIGIYPERNQLLLDVGSRALGKDTLEFDHYSKWGSIVGHEEFNLAEISQEVGVVRPASNATIDFTQWKVGDMVKILPNHSCLTATNFSEYFLVKSDQVVGKILPESRGFFPN